jgi:hypothetical protein
MIQMALSIATGLSHLHIEIIGTQVSLLFFCKKIIPDPDPDFFGESGSGFRPRIFYVRKLQKIKVAKFFQFFSGLPGGLPKFWIILWPSRKNIHLSKHFIIFFLRFISESFLPSWIEFRIRIPRPIVHYHI